jgi:hypothetical protein
MQGFPGFLTSTPLGRWETLKVSPKYPKGVTQDQTQDLRSDSQWSNQMSYRVTYSQQIKKIIACLDITFCSDSELSYLKKNNGILKQKITLLFFKTIVIPFLKQNF